MKSDRDARFARALTDMRCAGPVLLVELVLLILGIVTIASGNSQPQLQMPKLANYLGSQGLSIRRVFLDLMEDERNDHPVMMLRMLVSRSGDDSDPDAPLPCADRLSADVKKLKWIDDRVIKMADQHLGQRQ